MSYDPVCYGTWVGEFKLSPDITTARDLTGSQARATAASPLRPGCVVCLLGIVREMQRDNPVFTVCRADFFASIPGSANQAVEGDNR